MEITRIAGGIALVDVSARLPRHQTRMYVTRPASQIERIFFHKSGRLGAPGYRGAYNSARYCVQKRAYPRSQKPGWAGMPYTFWIPFLYAGLGYVLEVLEIELTAVIGRASISDTVVFRCQPDEIVSWHTGGRANHIGVSACFQGNSTVDGLSKNQIEIAEGLIPWALARYGLELPGALSWHSDRGPYGPPRTKPVCPGAPAVAWLEAYRAGSRRPA